MDAGISDLGHRRHLLAMDSSFQTHQFVGVGIVQNGSGPYRNYYTIDSSYTTDRRPVLTGVVYKDPESFGEYHLSYRTGDILSPKLSSEEPLSLQLADFIRSFRHGASRNGNLSLSYDVVRLAEAAQSSLDTGSSQVEIPDADPFRVRA